MNKQQLASTIWQSANQMRSKIEANEYKDYILGFMFYKYLSDREVSFLKGEKYSDEDIKKVTANDEKLVKHISENIGYFIAYEDLFSTWLSKGDDFDVSDVRDALSNFDINIEPTYKKLFENIFKTLQSGLSKLGETSTKQTKSIKALLKLIKRIPMDGKQDYDVLGFIYEYLISMFAANAGKKAGEFYTPQFIVDEKDGTLHYVKLPKSKADEAFNYNDSITEDLLSQYGLVNEMSREMLNAIDGEEFGPALDILMDKHICNYSARLLRSITGLDNRTISNMKKGENLTKSNVISACLGIHIPFRVSDHMLGLADLTLKMDSKSKVSDDNEVYDMILHLKWATDYGDIYDELKEQSKEHLLHQPPL